MIKKIIKAFFFMDYEKVISVDGITISCIAFFIQTLSIINLLFSIIVGMFGEITEYQFNSLMLYGVVQMISRFLRV